MKFIRLTILGIILLVVVFSIFIFNKPSAENNTVTLTPSAETKLEPRKATTPVKELDFQIPNYKWLESKNWIKPKENNPVLSPTEPWEGTAVLEPSVLFEDGIYKMWYCGGSPCALGYATSTDGINWQKYEQNPIFGLGHGGETGTVRQNSMMKYNGIYYLYYVNDSADMHVAESTDGINFAKREEPVIKHDNKTWENSHANSFQWIENNKWHMLYEAQDSDPFGIWKIGLATGTDAYTWEKYSGNPLFSMQTGTGMFGGPWVKKIDDTYFAFHHGSEPTDNLPTDIYIHYSKDLHNWYPIKDSPLVTRTEPDWEIDQVADPFLIEVDGKTFMYYDGDDNTAETGYRAWIGYVYFNGKLDDLAE